MASRGPRDTVQAAGATAPPPLMTAHALASTKASISEFRGGDDDITEWF